MPELNRTTHISFPDMTGYSDITTGIASGSLSLDEILLSGNLNFGEANANKFEVQLYGIENVANQKIVVWVVEDEGTTNAVTYPLFVGYVDSCKQDNMSYYRNIVAYDALYYKGDINVANWWTNFWADRSSATLATIRESLCAFVQISTVAGTYFNDDLVIYKAVSMTNISFRDVLAQICQLQCVFPNMNRQGNLEFISLDTSSAIDLRERYKKASSSFEDYVTKKIDAVSIFGVNDSVVGTTDPNNAAKNKYIIQGNIFAYGVAEGTETTLAQNIYNHVKDLQYVPMKLDMISSDLEYSLGQYVQTDKGYSFILSNSLSGSMLVEESIESKGDEYLSGTQRSYNSDITALRAQVETLTDDTIANALVSYQATNATTTYYIQDEWVKILDFTDFNVITTEVTDLIFMANVNLTAYSAEVETSSLKTTTPAKVKIKYVLNNGEIDYHPEQDYEDGKRVLPLLYQVANVPATTRINFSVWMKAETGSASILAGDAIGYIMAQKLKPNEIVSIAADLSNIVKNFPHGFLSYDGIQIIGTYENGDEEDVASRCTFEPVSGTAIDWDTTAIESTATFGELTADFEIETSPLFKVYGQWSGSLQPNASNMPFNVIKSGDTPFYLWSSTSSPESGKKAYTLSYKNILIDEDNKPSYSSISDSWTATFDARTGTPTDTAIDVVRVGNKWYADSCIYPIDRIEWFDLDTRTSGSITPTIHDPGTFPETVSSIRVYRESYNPWKALYIDGYVVYPQLRVNGNNGYKAVGYGVIGNGTFDIYLVNHNELDVTGLNNGVRVRTVDGNLVVEKAHFDTTDLLTYTELCTIYGAGTLSTYYWVGDTTLLLIETSTEKIVVDTVTGSYKELPLDTPIYGRTTYDPSQGVYVSMSRDTTAQYTYRTHLMYISYNLETWYRGGYLSPVGYTDSFDLNDSTKMIKIGDVWVGAVNALQNGVVAFSTEFQTDLSR